MRVKITLRCNECKQRNYNTMKNKKNDPDRIELKKYCRFCKKQTVHSGQAERVNIMAEAKKENFFARTGKRLSRWFREMKSELKKVVWPTKSQMVNNTVIVLVCTLIVGICIWVFDAVGGVVVNGIITLVRG